MALTLAVVAIVGGCGIEVPLGPDFPAFLEFTGWNALNADSCVGLVALDLSRGIGEARNVRVTVYHSTLQGEIAQTVPTRPDTVQGFFGSYFSVLPQLTNGETRFPRMGQIRWDGGSSPAAARRPQLSIDSAWCVFAADSVRGQVRNGGGWAYRVVLTVENRDGVRDLTLAPARVPAWSPFEGGSSFATVVRDSAGLTVVPRILKIRWEDYGGVRDSIVAPPATHAWTQCS